MADIDTYGISKENQRLFINTTEIPGVQSLDFSYNTNLSLMKYIGMTKNEYVAEGPYVGTVNVSTILISDDILINHTGVNGCNGYVLADKEKKDLLFGFQSGFLTSYNHRCSIGQIPSVDASFTVFGNIGYLQELGLSTAHEVQPEYINYQRDEASIVRRELAVIQTGASNLIFAVATPESINLTLNEHLYNRVQSYDININVQRLPVYEIGKTFPSQIETIWPIEIICNFKLEVDKYTVYNLRMSPWNKRTQTIGLSFINIENGDPLFSYSFPNMSLINESYNMETEDNYSVNVSYQGFIGR